MHSLLRAPSCPSAARVEQCSHYLGSPPKETTHSRDVRCTSPIPLCMETTPQRGARQVTAQRGDTPPTGCVSQPTATPRAKVTPVLGKAGIPA